MFIVDKGEKDLRRYFRPSLPVAAAELVEALKAEKYSNACPTTASIPSLAEFVKGIVSRFLR
jgi:organic radical activating enzyme